MTLCHCVKCKKEIKAGEGYYAFPYPMGPQCESCGDKISVLLGPGN